MKNLINAHKSELIAQTDVFLFLYVAAFTTLQAPAGNNKYCNLIAVFFMLLCGLYCFINSRSLISPFSVSFALFIGFAALSMLWSPVKDATKTTVITFGRLFVLNVLMYNYLDTQNKKELILRAFVAAGLTVTFVTALYYGPMDYIARIRSGERMGFALYAINYVAFILVIASLISLWFVMFRKRWWDIIPAAICLYASIGTGSRASILAFGVGVILLVFFRLKGKWRLAVPIFCVVMVVGAFLVLQMPMFGVLHERMKGFFALFTGKGAVDGSTTSRVSMVKWGFEQFLKTPVKGLGISSGSVVMAQHGEEYALYHNTYIELLAGGGIIGFSLYMFMFIYPFVKLIKPALKGDDASIIGVVLLLVYLVLFVFGSEYFEQATPVVICYLFLAVSDLRKKKEACA
jgi:O-antigen ligase